MILRVLRPGKKRWTSGHGIWVSDVFAWRGSPAAWNEDLLQVSGVSIHSADTLEREKLHRIGDDPVVASFALDEGATLKVAARHEHQSILAGPFVPGAQSAVHKATELRTDGTPLLPGLAIRRSTDTAPPGGEDAIGQNAAK